MRWVKLPDDITADRAADALLGVRVDIYLRAQLVLGRYLLVPIGTGMPAPLTTVVYARWPIPATRN